MKPRLFTLLTLVLLVAATWPTRGDEIPPSIVEVLVTTQRFDPQVPWKKKRPESRAGYGVVIAPGKLITTEELVHNAVLVEVRKPGDAVKSKATIQVADPRLNAALLSAPLAGFQPASWSQPVKIGSTVQLIQFDEAGKLQNGEGRISGIEVGALPSIAQGVLTFQVLTDLKLDRLGTPAFHDSKLVGLVMQYDESTQTSLVLPSAILQRFVEDVLPGPYRGVATAGLMWAPLIDPAQRRYLGLPADDKGVLVLRTIPGLASDKVLRSGDVILSWDGQAVDSQGYYQDPEFGRLSIVHQIAGRRHPGDTITILRWREQHAEEVSMTLDAYNDERALIPMNIDGRQAEYLVEGGLVLRELTADYLTSFGNQWMVRANPRLVNLYLNRAQAPEKAGERIVFLAGVLPAPINVGYHDLHDEVITHVNGKPVANLREVFDIRRQDGCITRFRTASSPVEIVLDRTTLPASNKQIAQLYGIPKLEFMRR